MKKAVLCNLALLTWESDLTSKPVLNGCSVAGRPRDMKSGFCSEQLTGGCRESKWLKLFFSRSTNGLQGKRIRLQEGQGEGKVGIEVG